MEGKVYICSWKQVPGGYRVWVAKRPKLAAEGATFEEADEELSSVICGATGDGESVHEYAPPPPTEDAQGSGLLDRLVMASPNARGEISNGAALFEGGYCDQCRHARGARTEDRIALAKADTGDAVLAKRSEMRIGGTSMHLYSADFLALLTRTERAALDFRPVTRRRGRKELLELLGGTLVVPKAAIRGKPQHNAWTCDSCGHEPSPMYLGTWIENHPWPSPPSWYVARTDLPEMLPSCMLIGNAAEPRLCFTRERWQELVGRPGTRAIKSNDVGVLADAWVDRAPKRQSLRAAEREARKK